MSYFRINLLNKIIFIMIQFLYSLFSIAWKIILTYYVAQIIRLLIFKRYKNNDSKSIMLIFGSGGHTTEMLMLFKNFNFEQYSKNKIHFVLAKTDTTSKAKILDYIQQNKVSSSL